MLFKHMRKLGIVFFPAFDWAISPTHPEREERLLYTLDQLEEEGLFDLPGISLHNPDIASREDVERVHFCLPDFEAVCPVPHRIAAGGAIRAASLVMEGKEDRAFALVRPPGHHSMRVSHGCRGFCNINTEAVMLEHLRAHSGSLRAAIVDTDCHHGDGTQDIYWQDPNTLFMSLHQDGRTLYPGSGFAHELGGPNAPGRTINVPLPPETGDEGFLYALDNLVLPLLADFKPDLIINSAGQDNHYSDPITNMRFSARGYAELTRRLNPHIAVLEGGYSVQSALPYVNLGIALALAGLDYSGVREAGHRAEDSAQGAKVSDYIKRLCDALLKVYFNPPGPLQDGELKKDAKGVLFVREREIYYDAQRLLEKRRESVTVCQDCAGALFIETVSERSPLAACVAIPAGACPKCAERGREFAAQARKDRRFSRVLVQDRSEEGK